MSFKKGNKLRLGIKHTERSKQMNRKKHLGIKKSKETKKKMSDAKIKDWKIKKQDSKYMKNWSERISKNNKGKLLGNKNPSKRLDVRKKISKALIGHKGVFAGKKRPEHSKKMKGRKQTREHIKKRFSKNKDTLIERIIEKVLLNLNIIYVKQEVIIGFCVDFYLPEYNLIIECDGDYWHNKEGAKEKDNMKDIKFKNSQIKILRLTEFDIKNNLDLCIKRIQLIIQNGNNTLVK